MGGPAQPAPNWTEMARKELDDLYGGMTPEQRKQIEATGVNTVTPKIKPFVGYGNDIFLGEFDRLAKERAAEVFKERQYKDGRNEDILLADQSARRNSIFANDVQKNPVDLYRSLF